MWRKRADVLHAEYADAIVAAGGVPVLLPPASGSVPPPAPSSRASTRLVVSGGADVDPARYGEEPHERTAGWREDRDAWELALLDGRRRGRAPGPRRLPRHAADGGGRRRLRSTSTPPTWSATTSTPPAATCSAGSPCAPWTGSRVAGCRGRGRAARSATTTSRSARTPGSRPPPGHPTRPSRRWRRAGDRFCVGVQWHPEMGRDQALFTALVAAAAER